MRHSETAKGSLSVVDPQSLCLHVYWMILTRHGLLVELLCEFHVSKCQRLHSLVTAAFLVGLHLELQGSVTAGRMCDTRSAIQELRTGRPKDKLTNL